MGVFCMPKDMLPRTSFSTPLSGSARETERRLRNIFQGPKRRPPLLVLALASALALSCGGLVSCQNSPPSTSVSQSEDVSSSQGAFSLSSSALEQLQSLTPDDLPLSSLEQLYSHSLDRTALLDALRQGAQSPLPPEQFQSTELWMFHSGPVQLNALAGAEQEGYLLVFLYGESGQMESFVFQNQELWDQVRLLFRHEGTVDQGMLARVQDRIDTKIVQLCEERGSYYEETDALSPNFTGGDVVDFQLQAAYDLPDGDTAYLYSLDLAIVCQYPERLVLAGGDYADDQGRLRNNYLIANLAILEEGGEISKCVFLVGDTIGILGSNETTGEVDLRQGTLAALEQAPDGGQL